MNNKVEYPRGIDEAKVINVIVTKSSIGDGTEKSPVRVLYQYWDFNGNLLAKYDSLNDNI